MRVLTIHTWWWNSHNCKHALRVVAMSAFPMRSSRGSREPHFIAATPVSYGRTISDESGQPKFLCKTVGQRSDKPKSNSLTSKQIKVQGIPLQNLYSAVRSRPAPPTKSFLSGRSAGSYILSQHHLRSWSKRPKSEIKRLDTSFQLPLDSFCGDRALFGSSPPLAENR